MVICRADSRKIETGYDVIYRKENVMLQEEKDIYEWKYEKML